MIFRGASKKSETTFVKQNRKLVHKCGFRIFGRPSEQDEIFDQQREIEVLGTRFEFSRLLLGMFRGAARKSGITFMN